MYVVSTQGCLCMKNARKKIKDSPLTNLYSSRLRESAHYEDSWENVTILKLKSDRIVVEREKSKGNPIYKEKVLHYQRCIHKKL